MYSVLCSFYLKELHWMWRNYSPVAVWIHFLWFKPYIVVQLDINTQQSFRFHTYLNCNIIKTDVIFLLTLSRPGLCDFEMPQVIGHVFVLRKLRIFSLLDLKPVLGSALCCMAVLLLRHHVWPTDPVFILSLTLQMLQRVAFHLPCNRSWTPILSYPLLPRDAFPQQAEGEEHGGKLFLKRQKGKKFTDVCNDTRAVYVTARRSVQVLYITTTA